MKKKYVKKPIAIEAVQWDGTNTSELMKFSRDVRFIYHEGADNIVPELYVQTREGDLYAKIGDYILKGIKNEVYPCAREIFEATYEEVPFQ